MSKPIELYIHESIHVHHPVETNLFDVLKEREVGERTASWLARKLGVSRERVSQLKRGRRPITREFMQRIADVLEMPVESLFTIRDDEQSYQLVWASGELIHNHADEPIEDIISQEKICGSQVDR